MEAYSRAGGLQFAKAIIETPQEPQPPGQQPPANGVPSWCICRKCCPMPTADENKCCRQSSCVTLQPCFQSLVLDRDALLWQLLARMDMLVDRMDFNNEGYRFAAYRQYILWQNGYLGRGNRTVPMGYIQASNTINNVCSIVMIKYELCTNQKTLNVSL